MLKTACFRRAFFGVGCVALCILVIGLLSRSSSLQGTPQASAEEKAKGKEKNKYVSITNCKLCHSDAKTGDQYGQWKKTKHAEAYATLGNAQSKEIAAKMGIKDPQKDAKCLKCHVTGAETPDLAKKIKEKDGVQCESCHGAGELYAKEEVFKQGRDAAIAKGLVIPDEKLCVKCHNKESPSYKEFNYKEMAAKVQHPNPQKKK